MDQRQFERFPTLPDRTMWPASLVNALDSGNYFVLAHEGEHVVLMSTIAGDLIRVQGNGTVQARIGINLETGSVIHPAPGTNIDRWQAEVFGKVELYEQRRQQLRDRPLDLSEWDFGDFKQGIPKDTS